jgi:hypothetical protein
MRLLGEAEDQVDVRMSVDELMLLRSALHEMCDAMHFTENDFQTILGVQKTEAESLLRHLETIADRLRLNLAHE